jgi:hypothetical protein
MTTMRRAFLKNPDDPYRKPDGSLHTDEAILRETALALAAYATAQGAGRDAGDTVFERITEGRLSGNMARRKKGSPEVPYSCCGDLAHWMLFALGCRDERLVNRDTDGGETPWAMGANITRLGGSGLVQKAGPGLRPKPGDILFLDQHGGHVCVLRSWDEGDLIIEPYGTVMTEDYGQPMGRRRTRKLTSVRGALFLDGAPLRWWLPLDRVRLTESALCPPGYEGGVEDENPYEEQGVDL